MRYFCSPNQKTVLRTRRIVELRSGPKDAKVAKKVPYLECGAVGKKSRFMKKSLIALAFGTLALGMAEFVMMGILPDVARDLGVSIPRAGDLISAYAVGVCVGAPATVLIARKRALKGILLALAALIVLGNVCASLAPDFWVLLAMRFVSGLPHGAFFGVGSIVAERVADPGHKTQAVSIMILGMTVANLFCVPLGTYLGSYLSWRLAFGMVGLWGIMALLLIARWVPALPALPDTGLKGQFRFLGSRAPWLILLATLLANGGVFCWYSYVTPTMTRVAGISGQAMTAVMMVAGLGMLVGNLAGGHLSDRFSPERVARFIQGMICLLLVGIFFAARIDWLVIPLMFLTTASLFGVSSPQQLLILENAPGGEMLGAASIQIAFNLGNALGAYFGGLPISFGLGPQYAALPGAAMALLGFVMFSVYCSLYGRNKLIEYCRKMKCADNREELFPVVDAAGRVVGRATRGECHGGSMLLHPVVHLHLFNSCGELYLQKRPAWKDIQPGRWDTAVGGHVDWGEEPLAALRREVREEVGVTDFEPQHVLTYLFESERERELVYVYKTVYDGPVVPSGELDGGRFWTLREIAEGVGGGIFTPNFEGEIRRVAELPDVGR